MYLVPGFLSFTLFGCHFLQITYSYYVFGVFVFILFHVFLLYFFIPCFVYVFVSFLSFDVPGLLAWVLLSNPVRWQSIALPTTPFAAALRCSRIPVVVL